VLSVVIAGVCVDVLLLSGVIEIVDAEESEVVLVTEGADVEVELVSEVVDKIVVVIIEELHGLQ